MHFSHPPSAEQVRTAWEKHPDAAGAIVVSPSPYGTCADIAAIADVCHRRGKPLIIDEAWGAHLPFHGDLPTWAMDAGADVCVVSVHKMGSGFEQGSVFHLQGDLADGAHLSACADLLMTTSPSVLIYSALDGWRRQMVERGEDLLGSALSLARRTRARTGDIHGLNVLEDRLLGKQASHDLLETEMAPREAFFGPTEMVSADRAAGLIGAEQLTRYPPGIPAVVPGERLNTAVIDYLRTGHSAGMAVPDATDPSLEKLRVVARR